MSDSPSRKIHITEVGPRDGLQNEAKILSAMDKIKLVDLLSACGIAEIEVSSFVSPRWVPQLDDADEVFAEITRNKNVIYSALVSNEQGMERALAANVEKISVFTAASETFSQKNTNASIQETLERFKPVIKLAKQSKLPVRAYISCVVACPYEGLIAPNTVRALASKLLDLGVDEIDLGETIGVAVPTDIQALYDGISDLLQPQETTLHLHDTRGTALACALAALQLGVVNFDTSCGGLGGCPYAPNSAGNLATEDLVYMCSKMGYEINIDMNALFAATHHVARALDRSLPGRVFNADGS